MDSASTFPGTFETRHSARNRMIEDHRYLVENLVACLMRRKRITIVDREDLIQDGMIGLIKAVDSFDASRGAQFVTWATTKVINAIRDALRSYDVHVEEESFREEIHAGDIFSPCAQVDAKVTLDALLPQLPTAERTAVTLHHLQGLKPAEVARRMGINRMQSGRLIERGMNQLRELVAQ